MAIGGIGDLQKGGRVLSFEFGVKTYGGNMRKADG